ncbi:MAG: hypothetical protein HZB26_03655 [Candidatus Hydrogenedentes bacterium]|nr:hypothetical protein [Candidatus Hydrogenedentota bacterium]
MSGQRLYASSLCLFAVALLFALTALGSTAPVQTLSELRAWMRDYYVNWTPETVDSVARAYEGVLTQTGGRALTSDEQRMLLGFTPDFTVWSVNNIYRQTPVEIEILAERYRIAVEDYLARPPIPADQQDVINRQLDSILLLIRDGVTRTAAEVQNETERESLLSFAAELDRNQRAAAANPLVPSFKAPLSDEAESALRKDIVKTTEETIAEVRNDLAHPDKLHPVLGILLASGLYQTIEPSWRSSDKLVELLEKFRELNIPGGFFRVDTSHLRPPGDPAAENSPYEQRQPVSSWDITQVQGDMASIMNKPAMLPEKEGRQDGDGTSHLLKLPIAPSEKTSEVGSGHDPGRARWSSQVLLTGAAGAGLLATAAFAAVVRRYRGAKTGTRRQRT